MVGAFTIHVPRIWKKEVGRRDIVVAFTVEAAQGGFVNRLLGWVRLVFGGGRSSQAAAFDFETRGLKLGCLIEPLPAAP